MTILQLQRCWIPICWCIVSMFALDLPYKIPGPRKLTDKIAIVGAGPAGVHMALLLKEKGFKNIEILEISSRIGGKSLSILNRGAIQELGTVYLSREYTIIDELLARFTPSNTKIGFPTSTIFKDNMSRPIQFAQYLGGLINQLRPELRTEEQIVGAILQTLDRYIQLHIDIFGVYEGGLMPEPTKEQFSRIEGTFMDFIMRNKFEILIPIFTVTTTVQGYGQLDEIAALYGLLWNTPILIESLKARVRGEGAGGLSVLKEGFQSLWEAIVKQSKLRVIFNTNILRVYRPAARKFNRQRGRYQPGHSTCVWICKSVNGGIPLWKRYDFLIWSPEMKETMFLWRDRTLIERRLFSSTRVMFFTSSIFDSLNVTRGEMPIDYWVDNVLQKRDNSVWAQRNSFGVLNMQSGLNYTLNRLPNGNDNSDKTTAVVYQMGDQRLPRIQLKRILLEHFKKFNGKDLMVKYLKVWRYFPRYPPTDIEKGIIWKILRFQGRLDMWYIGSSVIFESVKSVVEYNNILIRNMAPPIGL